MLLDEQVEQAELIYKYFHLDRQIRRYQQRKDYIEWVFMQRTFCSNIQYDGHEIRTVAPRVEKIVTDKVDSLIALEKLTGFNRKRQKYFNDYLHSLTPEALKSLENKYQTRNYLEQPFDELDQATYEEIQEIELAVKYEFFPYLVDVDPDEELPDMEELLEMNFNDIMEVMGI